jgi:P-type conjugative transfer protein TrbJ
MRSKNYPYTKKQSAIAASILLAMSLYVLAPSFAGGGLSGGSTEVTQIANNAELIKQVAESIKMVHNQIVQIENMIFNTLNLPNQIISTFTENIDKIRGIAEKIEGVAYQVANLGERFQSQFKGFKPTTDYVGLYKDLARQTKETADAAINVIESVAQENKKDSQKLENLAQSSGSAEGRQQAIQAGNQLLAFLGEQLMKLQELNMSYSTFAIEQIQAKNEKEERVEANVQEIHRGLKEGAAALVD